jgi:hypothetical protein
MLVENLLGLAPPVPKGEQILEQAWERVTTTLSKKSLIRIFAAITNPSSFRYANLLDGSCLFLRCVSAERIEVIVTAI